MRAVLQRVKYSKVSVNGALIGAIGQGLLVLLAVHRDDSRKAVEKICDKIINLRIFHDKDGKMNKSVKDVGGEIMVVSQFTLYGDTAKGNRPSFTNSAPGPAAEEYYNLAVDLLEAEGMKVASGKFGAMMDVDLVNDGPVTLIIDCL